MHHPSYRKKSYFWVKIDMIPSCSDNPSTDPRVAPIRSPGYAGWGTFAIEQGGFGLPQNAHDIPLSSVCTCCPVSTESAFSRIQGVSET